MSKQPCSSEGKLESRIKKQLEQYNITRLYYMAPFKNAVWISIVGILCRSLVKSLQQSYFEEIASERVVKRRERKWFEDGRSLLDYVPLYFTTHTPTQYVITRDFGMDYVTIPQEHLVFIEVDAIQVFKMPGVIFTDGNAASRATNFYTDLADLDRLDWQVLRTPNCWSSEYKRKKAAEVLVPKWVPPYLIVRFVTYNEETRDNLIKARKQLLKEIAKMPVEAYGTLGRLEFKCEVDRSHYY